METVSSEVKILSKIEELRIEIQKINDRSVFQDSIEIGTPSKGGAIKVYFNADDPTGAQERIQNAVDLRDDFNAALAASRTSQEFARSSSK